jgi:hypothetical protein
MECSFCQGSSGFDFTCTSWHRLFSGHPNIRSWNIPRPLLNPKSESRLDICWKIDCKEQSFPYAHNEDTGRSGSIAPLNFNLGAQWRWVVRFTLRPLFTVETAFRTYWIGGRVSPTASLDALEKTKIFSRARNVTKIPSFSSPVRHHRTVGHKARHTGRCQN